jgi:hypothetical protein
VENEEDLALTDLTPHCNYRPSQEIAEAIKGATIGWATSKGEGETEPTDDNANTGGGDAPIGELKYSDWTETDLKCVLPAFCYLIHRAKEVVEDVIVIINTNLKQEITQGFIDACEKNEMKCLCLKGIDKERGHPTELGMKQICEQVAACLHKK